MEFTPAHMENLVSLLRPPEPEILQGDDLPPSGFDISSTRGKIPPSEDAKTPKTIEEYEEQEAKEMENLGKAGTGLGGLKTPEYTMNYQQSVSAEDVYLQVILPIEETNVDGYGTIYLPLLMVPKYSKTKKIATCLRCGQEQIGPKTPGSASCENLIIRIKMPGDKKENVDLVVDTSTITVTSSQYSLRLPLPHEVNPDRSKANWDGDSDTLVLTLKLDRELDFVNF